MTRVPPRVATWLLERWGPAVGRESLVGDLAEEFAGGRSSVWYWRQALMAIGVGIGHDALAHRWTVARGLALCHLLLWSWGGLAWLAWDAGAVPVWNWTATHEFDLVRAVLWGSGLAPMLVAQVCGAIVVGWFVARCHAVVAPSAVSVSAASVLVLSVASGVWRFGPDGYLHVLMTSLAPSASLAGVVSGIVVGGVLGTKVDSRIDLVR